MRRIIKLFLALASSLLVLLQLLSFTERTHLQLRSESGCFENKFADTTLLYNACSTHGRRILESLPSVHRALPVSVRMESSGYQFQRRHMERTSESQQVCQKLFEGKELTCAEEKWISDRNSIERNNLATLLAKTGNCARLRREFSEHFVAAREEQFPIAYAINLNQHPEQIFRFLKLVYRPHNLYCLHYDTKTDSAIKEVILNIASCLGNVIVPRKVENVYRGWHTLVDAHLSCFSDLSLARLEYPWRYALTLSGMELPLRTNAEIVTVLERLNGTSAVDVVGGEGQDEYRFKWKWVQNTQTGWISMKDTPQDPLPHGLKIYKSSAYLALSYQFVQHLLCSPIGKALREYMRDVYIPEESIYAILFMHPDTPGSYRAEHGKNIFKVTASIWISDYFSRILNFPTGCSGWIRHSICILSAKDLHRLSYKPGVSGYASKRLKDRDTGPLFYNKFNLALDSVVLECMEGELSRRNRIEYNRDKLSAKYYGSVT